MTPLHSLITALIRLLGLYFAVRSLDNAAVPIFTLAMQRSIIGGDLDFQIANPWTTFLPIVAFYLILAALIFFIAPKLARLMIGSESHQNAEIPWHETLLFCCGGLIVSWAFVRLSDTIYGLVRSAANNDGQYTLDNAMLTHLFMTAVLFGSGVLWIAKFHRISAWIASRRATANKPVSHP